LKSDLTLTINILRASRSRPTLISARLFRFVQKRVD